MHTVSYNPPHPPVINTALPTYLRWPSRTTHAQKSSKQPSTSRPCSKNSEAPPEKSNTKTGAYYSFSYIPPCPSLFFFYLLLSASQGLDDARLKPKAEDSAAAGVVEPPRLQRRTLQRRIRRGGEERRGSPGMRLSLDEPGIWNQE